MSKILPAKIIIARSSGRQDDKCVHVSIEDEASGCRVLELNLTLEEWAKATFSSFGEATMELYTDCPAGKKREVKEELVSVPDMWTGGKEWAKDALKPFEVHGWVAHKDDLFNHHHRVGRNKQRVTFIRFVENKDGV